MKKYRIALYIRLSLEDAKTDSMSISSQRNILREYASELSEYANAELTEFVDNGYSGANFERPAVQELLDLVRANRIDCIMVPHVGPEVQCSFHFLPFGQEGSSSLPVSPSDVPGFQNRNRASSSFSAASCFNFI